MNRSELKRIYKEMKSLMEELETAIYSDTESYTSLNIDYEEVLNYYNTQSNAEEGL